MNDARERRIALCLSGGGLRATLFHLGMIRALRECRIDGRRAIERVDHIYSVSGGSILAAHMLVNWESYRDDDHERFADAENAILRFVRSNLRDRVLRRWLLVMIPYRIWRALRGNPASARTRLLQNEYERLLDKVDIESCYPTGRQVPRFHLLATDFKTGELCAFTGVNLEIEDRKGKREVTGCGSVRLAAAVAASSAFPPLFPPFVVSPAMLAQPPGKRFRDSLLLTDGGVYDNLGIEKLRRALARDAEYTQIAIISDAGAPFQITTKKSFSMVVSRNIRASDILMSRISEFTADSIERLEGIEDTVVPISAKVRYGSLSNSLQQLLRLVRTDLDGFDTDIAEMLIVHGYEVTLASLRGTSWVQLPVDCSFELDDEDGEPAAGRAPPELRAGAGPAAAGESPVAPQAAVAASRDGERRRRIAEKAARRSFWRLALDIRDWPMLLIGYSAAAALLWAGYYGATRYLEYRRGQELQAELEKFGNYQDRISALSDDLAASEEKLERLQKAAAADNLAQVRAMLGLAPRPVDRTRPGTPIASGRPQPEIVPDLRLAPSAVPSQSKRYDQRVYIQFAGSIPRERITALNEGLRSAGWNVQGASGERTPNAARLNEVRYGGDNGEAARSLADAISAVRIGARTLTVRHVAIVGDRNLEVWISR